MVHLDVKPLSLNNAYRGRRFKTSELEQFKKDIGRLLPRLEIPAGPLSVTYTFGVSSKAADGDNLIKAFQDCLGECYGFNDKRIYEWHVRKIDVPKGKEFVEFDISTIDTMPTARYTGTKVDLPTN
jgi:Holliday junction resolvase RusA-like endonuclease